MTDLCPSSSHDGWERGSARASDPGVFPAVQQRDASDVPRERRRRPSDVVEMGRFSVPIVARMDGMPQGWGYLIEKTNEVVNPASHRFRDPVNLAAAEALRTDVAALRERVIESGGDGGAAGAFDEALGVLDRVLAAADEVGSSGRGDVRSRLQAAISRCLEVARERGVAP